MKCKCKKFLVIYLCLTASAATLANDFSSLSCGEEGDTNRKIYVFNKINDHYNLASPFHDIPLFPEEQKDVVNMIVEIPQAAQDKLEINKTEKYNPLMYDIRDNKIRKIEYQAHHTNIKGYPFHYGALPQTWEHSGVQDSHTKLFGDNDPVDAFDISTMPRKPGDIVKVKVLGAIAMIDNKETDWKILVINTEDEMASKYNDITDIPWGVVDTIYDFLLNYKTSEGKSQNEFFKKIYWNQQEALDIIGELHRNWRQLCDDQEGTLQIIQSNRPEKQDEMPECNLSERPKIYEEPMCPTTSSAKLTRTNH